MTYVYLNVYKGGYLYIGQHTWKGQGIDPSYHGSSSVAKSLGWSPIEERILEVVDKSRKNIAESYWINHYATLYGIADCALCRYPVGNRIPALQQWIKKFKTGV